MFKNSNQQTESAQAVDADPNDAPPLWAILVLPLMLLLVPMMAGWSMMTGSHPQKAEL